MQHLLRDVQAAVTDLGYLLAAASPRVRRLQRWWAQSYYRRRAPQYDRYVGSDPVYFTPLDYILPNLPQAAVIVEVGAGTGAATRRLKRRYPRAIIAAIDLSAPMLSRLSADDAVRLVGDTFALPVTTGAADLAIVNNAPFAVDELLRVVKPGGVAVVVLPGAVWIPARLGRFLIRRSLGDGAARVQERRVGTGVAWVFHR